MARNKLQCSEKLRALNLELSRGSKSVKPANKSHSTSPVVFQSIKGGEASPPQRLSPSIVHVSSPQGSSPRTSPGLVAGHYAGCKFTEPPLASSLPAPPQHWMQTPLSKRKQTSHKPFFSFAPKQETEQLGQQLKFLLKVQA